VISNFLIALAFSTLRGWAIPPVPTGGQSRLKLKQQKRI